MTGATEHVARRGAGGDLVRAEARVIGHVQGVGFRWFVVTEANRLGCTGWVANEADGSVRLVAEGSRLAVERLFDGVREGPRGARVEDVRVVWTTGTGAFRSFGVRASGHRGD